MATGNLFKVRVGDAKLKAKLAAISGADMKPAFETIGRVIATKVRLCFKLGIDPFGQPWAPLKYRKGQPLRDTGRLQRSITSVADSSGVVIGTNVRYARAHQRGKSKPEVRRITQAFGKPLKFPVFATVQNPNVPARPFLPLREGSDIVALPPLWSTAVVRALRQYFQKRAKAAG